MRGFLNAIAFLAGTTVLLSGFLVIYIGIAGTGAFTSEPPPDHVPWFGIAMILAIGAALECLIFCGWRALTRVIDAIE